MPWSGTKSIDDVMFILKYNTGEKDDKLKWNNIILLAKKASRTMAVFWRKNPGAVYHTAGTACSVHVQNKTSVITS